MKINQVRFNSPTAAAFGNIPKFEPTDRFDIDTSSDIALFAARRAKKIQVDGITEDLFWQNGNLLTTDDRKAFTDGSRTKPYGEGSIKVGVSPTADGMRIKVKSHHKTKNEKVQLTLQVRVINQGKEQLITLGVLNSIKDKLNTRYYEATNYYDVTYDDINAYLQKHAPHLTVVPGTTLAVSARWDAGHEWGGYNRNGMIEAPRPLKAASPVAIRTNPAGAITYDDVPLDIAVPVDDDFYQRYKAVVKKNSKLTTRMECEYKGATSEDELEAAVRSLYELSDDADALKKLLGDDWSIEPITRYYVKDDNGNVLKDARGFPKIDPMKDIYYDSPSWSITKRKGALRVRSNKQKSGSLNVKPGNGVLDPQTGIRKRVEIGLDLRRGFDIERLKDLFTEKSEYYNPFNEMEAMDGRIREDKVLQPALEVVGDRHKFKLTNQQTGEEIEISCDFTKAKTLRDADADPKTGEPREAEHFQIEMEIDHLQINSTNVVTGPNVANRSWTKFRNQNDQVKYLSELDEDESAINTGRPRIHTREDLKNPNALKEELKALGTVKEKLIAHLFKNGMKPATQKAHMAWELMGLDK